MKLMFASDLHGSYYWTRRLEERLLEEKPLRLILLGDLLNHGPRNPFTQEYDPAKVVSLLNTHRELLLCVRGNCDSEVDQVCLEVPMLADYFPLFLENKMVFCTHGHLFHPGHLPPLRKGDVLINGHTHIPAATLLPEGVHYLNPGSAALPKEDTAHSYMVYEDGCFTIKNLDGQPLECYRPFDN